MHCKWSFRAEEIERVARGGSGIATGAFTTPIPALEKGSNGEYLRERDQLEGNTDYADAKYRGLAQAITKWEIGQKMTVGT